ncbi:hypothetical protein BJ875DRAFT_470183 [Amylocarpus encephaloides]|uniref:LysM domain-containing protein n=1 Tax=Amylocarpus encephaloides TaxID=45428 RepID=A0A9P7YCJ0_9HELO|nr:hypothetical protein BJ875DRAFT_470183 [Amylocarpus encephaloides]
MIPSFSRSNTPNARAPSPRVASDASIRPRNRRLNALEDHEQELSTTSGTSTPDAGSRAASPIPAKHPSRGRGAAGRDGNGRTSGGLLAPGPGNRNGLQARSASETSSPIGGVWNTGWMSSAFQQVATSVLGSMAGEDGNSRNGSSQGTGRRRAGSATNSKKSIPAEWGPSEPTDKLQEREIGIGSTREREAAVRAKKTQRILEGRDDENNILDTNGHYKRRTSTDDYRPSSAQDEGDALVYIHHVKPQDTFAGVVLKYNCPKDVFKKANGLWSEGGLQFRKTVVLPVDACTIKGRPCEPPSEGSPYGVDLLAPTPGTEEPPFTNGDTWPPTSTKPETSAERPVDDDHPWAHVRWVLINSSPNSKPVEIGRMSRNALGYFPPRRRKSVSFRSAVSTPRGSLDLGRLSTWSQSSNDPSMSASSTPSRRTSNLGHRPSQPLGSLGSYFPNIRSGTRPRRESVGEAADRLGWMRGPGGVGTLGPKVRKPGPGNDGLNQWANKHIPGLAIDSLPSVSLIGAEQAHFGFSREELAAISEAPNSGSISGSATPGNSQNMGLENAAAAVEGFFRKLVVKGPGTPKLGARADSDLIELLDGAGSDDGRGFEISPGRVRSSTPLGTGREDLDGLIRGRATAGMKGGKGD